MPPKVLPTAISLQQFVRQLPKVAIRRLDSPQAGQQLAQAAICKRGANDYIGRGEAVGGQVDQRQQERRQRETTETQRSRVTEFAVVGRSVKTGLEISAERRQASRVPGIYVCEGVAAVVVRLALPGRVLRVVDTVRAILHIVNIAGVLLLRRHCYDRSTVKGCPDHGRFQTGRPRRMRRVEKTGEEGANTRRQGTDARRPIYLRIELTHPREER